MSLLLHANAFRRYSASLCRAWGDYLTLIGPFIAMSGAILALTAPDAAGAL